MTTLSTTVWGDPTAPRRALLVHGITSSSQSWTRVAPELASRGYQVTAPDLLGHGLAGRSDDYAIAALARELQPLLHCPYDVLVGHSLGALVVAALLPLLKDTRVVLVDPPLEQTPAFVAQHKQRVLDIVKSPKTPEAYLAENPRWSREDAIARATDVRLCDMAAVEAIFDHNVPWSFTHHLATPPTNVKLTILAADPSKGACVREEDFAAYPHVTARTVWGAGHLIPLERPDAIVSVAL